MSTGYSGTDSVAMVTEPSGFDTQTLAQRVRGYWPAPHQYWGRYFGVGPGSYGLRDQTLMGDESFHLLQNGYYQVVPLSSPGDVGNNDYSLGGLRAQAATGDIQKAINAGHMDLPDTPNHAVYVYLDIEYGAGFTPLNREYWKGSA